MIFKITPGFNVVVKIAAVILLIIEALKTALNFTATSSSMSSYVIIYLIGEVFFLFVCLYIIAVLRFFKERKMISAAFIVFTLVEFCFGAGFTIMFETHGKHLLLIFSLMSFIYLLASGYIFIMSLFMRQRIIFGPVLMFTISLLALELLSDFLLFVLPTLNDLLFHNFISPTLMDKISSSVSGITLLLPIAVLLLISRVNGFLRGQREENVTFAE